MKNSQSQNNPNFTLSIESLSERKKITSDFSETEEIPDWHGGHQEGELSVDVLGDEDNIIIVSTMSGAATEKIDVNIHNDLLTIRGIRKTPFPKQEYEYFHEECYWGAFSRTVVLPVDVKADLAYAEYKNGILEVFIPKHDQRRDVPINVIEE